MGQIRADAAEVPELRWFGGLSFFGRERLKGIWSAFGVARFQAPVVWVEGGADADATLRVALPDTVDAAAAHAEFASWREQLSHPPAHAGAVAAPPTAAVQVRAGDRGGWIRMVERALAAIREGRFAKVVLARPLMVRGVSQPLEVLARLRAANPDAWTWLFEPEPGRVFLGASPESLAVVEGRALTATAVAGSRPRGASAEEDARLGRELLDSGKDRHEHDLVVQGMAERLGALVERVDEPPETRLLSLSGIHHLEAVFRAKLRRDVTALDVIEALHPTPAVCGSPRDAARAFLLEEEGFERGWYGGPVGWLDGDGDGVFVPALRCALLHERTWHLVAGAGIVEGSDPAREWDETRLKFRTALAALDGVG